MNERGFFNLAGLCLLLIISLSVMSIQELEKNYSYEVNGLQSAVELQNAADSGLAEAIDYTSILPNNLTMLSKQKQRKILTKKFQSKFRKKNSSPLEISVEVWAERGIIDRYERNYSTDDDSEIINGYIDTSQNYEKTGIFFLSVASCEDEFSGEKIFARSLAYIEDGENILHFMNTAERGALKLK